MKRNIKSLLGAGFILTAIALPSCYPLEDPGGLIEDQRSYEVSEFNRLEMGDAFIIDVVEGEAQSITIKGDARNLDDLLVYVESGTLKIRFDHYRNRRHHTYISITMPSVTSVNFGGASTSTVSGLVNDSRLDVIVSGASKLTLIGRGVFLNTDVSGASRLYAFDYIADEVYANVSGASKARVFVLQELNAIASGASYIGYKGEPLVHANVSGESSVRKE